MQINSSNKIYGLCFLTLNEVLWVIILFFLRNTNILYFQEHGLQFCIFFQIGSYNLNVLGTSEREMGMLQIGVCSITYVKAHTIHHLCPAKVSFKYLIYTICISVMWLWAWLCLSIFPLNIIFKGSVYRSTIGSR